MLTHSHTAASALIRPQPHFLAAGIAAMAAAAMQANNNISTNVTLPTSTTALTTSIAGAPSWGQPLGGGAGIEARVGPPGHPPIGFPFGIPGLRHPLFSTGMLIVNN